MNFEMLGLRAELVAAVAGLGFDAPMPIQEQAIPVLLANETDFVGRAQTGTGKTGAFGLPLIQLVDTASAKTQGLVLCPTRELCLQITKDMDKFSSHIKKLKVAAVYGGASITNQIKQIKSGAQIIVATPGRLLDLINRKVVRLAGISHVVLDEADEMLKMGFQEDIDAILHQTPSDKRTWLFSATMPVGVATIARKYLTAPLEVTVGGKNSSPANIGHLCYVIHEKNRYQALKRIIDFIPDIFGLVFCRTRKETATLAEALLAEGYHAEALHGDLSQFQRDSVMRKFRSGAIRILVATDVAARGIDVDDISHVIHYTLPDETETYTHRSGRTARAGKSGTSMAIINKKEQYKIRRLEKQRKIRFQFAKIPTGNDICRKKLLGFVDKIKTAEVAQEKLEAYLPEVHDALDSLGKEELINRLMALEFNRFLANYRQSEDINVKIGGKESNPAPRAVKQSPKKADLKVKVPRAAKQGPKKVDPKFKAQKTQRFWLNFGRLDKITEGTIVRLICDNSGIRSSMIGAIDLNREFSFFEISSRAAAAVNGGLKNARLDGRPVTIRKVLKNKRKKVPTENSGLDSVRQKSG